MPVFYRQEITFLFSKPVCSLLWDFVVNEGIRVIVQLPVKAAALSGMDGLRHSLRDVMESICQRESNIGRNEQRVELLLAGWEVFEQRLRHV